MSSLDIPAAHQTRGFGGFGGPGRFGSAGPLSEEEVGLTGEWVVPGSDVFGRLGLGVRWSSRALGGLNDRVVGPDEGGPGGAIDPLL